jgi:membrane protein
MVTPKIKNTSQARWSSEWMKIKAAGVWDVLSDSIKNFNGNGDANQAAAISLYIILSAVPLFILTAIVTGSAFASNPQIITNILEPLRDFNPNFSEKLLAQLGQIKEKKQLLGTLGILGLIWSSTAIFNAMETALNNTFRSQKKRNYIISKLLAIFMIPLGWSFGAIGLIISYAATVLISHRLQPDGGPVIYFMAMTVIFLRQILPYLISVICFYLIYWITPTAKVRPFVLLAGSALFALLMELANHFLAWYFANHTRYAIIFGGVEPVILLIIWIFYLALVFLFCAELMSSYERRNLLLLERAMLKPHKSFLKVDERLFKKFGRIYPKDSLVFNEGDAGHEMFYVLSGRIALEKDASKVKKLLAEMLPGQYFGEMAALINAPRTASARALEDSHLAVIDDKIFSSLIRESRDVGIFMLKEFSQRLKNTDTSLEQLTNQWVRLVVINQFLENPNAKIDEHLPKIAQITKRYVTEIQEVIDGLIRKGVIAVKPGNLAEVVKDKTWSIVNDDEAKSST